MKMIKKYLVELITYAANAENVDITVEQTYNLINNLETLHLKEYDYNVVMNIYHTYKQIINNEIEFNNNLPISTLMEINKNVGKNIVINNGQLRNSEVNITGTNYIPKPVSYELINQVLLNELYETKPSIDNILNVYLKMMKYQPFNDGNKRTSLIFTNLLLNKFHNQVLLVNEKQLDSFKDKLINYYNDENNKQDFKIFLKKHIKSKDIFLDNDNI